MEENVIIDMGKFEVMHNPATLVCIGLGSCIGIGLYDAEKHVGGLGHIMLPDSKEFNQTTNAANLKYADVMIEEMLKKLNEKGCAPQTLTAKIAGGAQLFKVENDVSFLNIGARNTEAVKKILSDKKIRLASEDTGGGVGRTIRFDLKTGMMDVKTKDYQKVI